MASFRLTIEDGEFRDNHGRQVVLRGINVAGDCKLPSEPDQPSHDGNNFFDGDNVTFHNRPFPKADAAAHFARLRRYGFNTIRYLFTWEAIEAAGPGKYDEVFIQHTIDVLRIAKSYGFYIFMDPHQDVWSRFTGGSGAPMWTLYACGMNPENFVATDAAIIHNLYPQPSDFPRMIWSTNYFRLATGTMFTLFFAGKTFAPKCIIDGVNIQDYLQNHFVGACAHLAKRIHEAGGIENEVVIGWESLNEPNRCMVGYQDLTSIPKGQLLKKGTCPTMWQTFLTGMGRACEIETWEMGSFGPYKTGTKLVDPQGQLAWLSVGYDDSRYGWTRDPGWKLGECVWAQHGVWDTKTDSILRKDYFAKHPETGKTIDYPDFNNTFFMDFWRNYKNACRAVHKDCIMLMQFPTLELPPKIKGTPDDDKLLVFTPHYYDGITLMMKHWNSTWNVDVVGILRGKYYHPAFAIKIGETAIRNSMKSQLMTLRQEGLERTGKHPCILSEFGIPYDMDDKRAYRMGDYSSQCSALDANYFAVEGSGMEGHCLWVYTAQNSHEWGDNWNGEDLSIYSRDDLVPSVSALPKDSSSTCKSGPSSVTVSREVLDENSVTPANLEQTITNLSIGSTRSARDPELTNSPGYRAAEAFIRPTPTVVAGHITSSGFDMKSCLYSLSLKAAQAARDEAPTEIYLPDYHFPRDQCEITVTSGKWEISIHEDEGVALQKLRWWHPEGEHSMTVTGIVRNLGASQGSAEDDGYEQCQLGYLNNCSIM